MPFTLQKESTSLVVLSSSPMPRDHDTSFRCFTQDPGDTFTEDMTEQLYRL